MLQDIAPHIYRNQMSWKEPDADDFVLCYRGRTLYCKVEDRNLVLPRVKDVAADALQYAFSIDERADYLLSDAELKEANGFSYFDTGKLRTLVPGPALMAAAAGESLYRWYSGQRFCGRCGKPMEKSKIERAMVCPACGNTVYPKICPAVIVAIHDGDRLVLTKYKDRPVKHYALVAGFNEIGESIEETVHARCWRRRGCGSGTCAFINRSLGSLPIRCSLASLPSWTAATRLPSRRTSCRKPAGFTAAKFRRTGRI